MEWGLFSNPPRFEDFARRTDGFDSMRRPIATIPIFLLGLCLLIGCKKHPSRASLEEHAIAHVVKQIGMYESLHPTAALTNALQLFRQCTNGGWGYPSGVHRKLLASGASAGFTNSIYEKYVFIVPPIRDESLSGYALILLNAQPFEDPAHRLRRMVVLRTESAPADFRVRDLDEVRIQRIFQSAGREIPKLSLTPPVPILPAMVSSHGESLYVRGRSYFNGLAGHLGIGHSNGWLIILLLGAAVVIAGVAFGLIFIRKSRR